MARRICVGLDMEDILHDIKNIKITTNNIRFLIVILAVLAVFIVHHHAKAIEQYLYIAIALFTVIGFVNPKLFTPLYKLWMAISICIGFVTGTILFSLVFLLGFTPIGFLMKLFQQEPMDLSLHSSKESYWDKKKKTKNSSLEKQY